MKVDSPRRGSPVNPRVALQPRRSKQRLGHPSSLMVQNLSKSRRVETPLRWSRFNLVDAALALVFYPEDANCRPLIN